MTSTPLTPLPLFNPNILTNTEINENDFTPLPFLIQDTQSKRLLSKGHPPPIASITADLDLAAKEEQMNDSHLQQPSQETLKEIDAMVSGSADDHEDDTDLGFVFDRTSGRNENGLLSPSSKDKLSQNHDRRSQGESSNQDSTHKRKTQSMIQDSLLMPSPSKSPLYRERTAKSQSRQDYHSSSHMNHQQFRASPHYAKFPSGSHANGRQSNMQQRSQNKYGHGMPYNQVGQRLPPPPHVRSDSGYNQQHQSHHQFGLQNSYYHPTPHNSHNNLDRPMHASIKMESSGISGSSRILSSPHRMQENIEIRYDNDCEKKSGQKLDKGNVSTKTKTLLRSPPVKKRRVVGSWDERSRKKDVDLVPIGSPSNVFRSPKNHTKHSSIAPQYSVSFTTSFEINGSPSSKLDDMFPPSNSFEFGENLPGINGDDGKFMLSNSMSEDDIILPSPKPKRDTSHKKQQSSPCLMFDSVLSPFRRSPHKYTPGSGRRTVKPSSDIFGVFDASPVTERSPMKINQNTSNISVQPMPVHKRPFFPTKTSTGSNVQRWSPVKNNPPFASPGSFRFQVSICLTLTTSLYFLSIPSQFLSIM